MRKNEYIVPALKIRKIDEDSLLAASVSSDTDNPIHQNDDPTSGEGGAKKSLFDTDWDSDK